MRAVILAAGIGSRLKTLTADKPKCMVTVNGRCIIDYQIGALLAAGVESVHVVSGFRAEQLEAHLRSRYPGDSRISLVENVDYLSTNNMYSLSLCVDFVRGEPFLLMNADVVFDESIVRSLIEAPGSRICVDVGAYNEESMKVTLAADGLSLGSISKAIPQCDALGSSIDVYRFDSADSALFFDHIGKIIHEERRMREWTEVALDDLMRSGRLRIEALDISGRPWYEIDNMADLMAAEVIFGRTQIPWNAIGAAFIDMDGTLYRGMEAIAGAADFVRAIRERVPSVFFLSNNSSKSHDQYVTRLNGMDIPASDEDIVLSSDAVVRHLLAAGIRRVYVVGTTALAALLASHGIEHTTSDAEAIVLGYDTELTYQKLREAALLLQDGERPYIATHPDLVCPTEHGPIPDIGSIIALLEKSTGRRPDLVFGKPKREMIDYIFEQYGIPAESALFVGDRVYTDYEMARQCGAFFIGVLSGEATRADFEGLSNIAIFPSVAEVFGADPACAHLEAVLAD